MDKKKKLIIPKFASEAADAKWHEQHKRELESAMQRRIDEGSTSTLRHALGHVKLVPVTIRLSPEDLATARRLAAHDRTELQTYIKMLLREALQLEAYKKEGLRPSASAMAAGSKSR